ncbi:MAG: hypothetical protein HPY61_00045 [Methanotrichaceae archaeon]|nr:hypothetical protein [Methanotrichaceae archaeon]
MTILTGLSLAGTNDYNPQYEGRDVVKYTYEYDDDVEGDGYMMVRADVNTNNLSLLEYMHGSGSIDYAHVLDSKQKTAHDSSYYYTITKDGGFLKKSKGANSEINFTIQKDFVQSPHIFAFGTGWYAARPITYDSLLKEKTVAKSYQEGVMLHHQLEYARGYVGDISVYLNCTGPDYKVKGKGLASMKIEDFVTQGTVHVGMLFTDTLKATQKAKSINTQGWRAPIIDIDSDYVGDFHIKKNLKIEIEKSWGSDCKDWLPCCFGGWGDMDEVDTLPIAEDGVFDCTCREAALKTYKPAWNGTTAQFPNDIYATKP